MAFKALPGKEISKIKDFKCEKIEVKKF